MNDRYKAGTRRGAGITFKRDDDELIQHQKEHIGSIIKGKMKEKKITYRNLEELTNIYNPQISAMLNAKNSYIIDNFLRVLNALGLEFVIEEDAKALAEERTLREAAEAKAAEAIKEESEEYDPNKIDLIINMLEQLKSK